MPNCIASQCLDGNSTSQQQTLSIGSRIVVPENRNVWSLAERCKEDVWNQMGFWFVIFPAARVAPALKYLSATYFIPYACPLQESPQSYLSARPAKCRSLTDRVVHTSAPLKPSTPDQSYVSEVRPHCQGNNRTVRQ